MFCLYIRIICKLEKGDLSTFYKVDCLLLWFLNMVGYCQRLVLTCFADDSVFGSYIIDISYWNNYFYSSYESANNEDDSKMPD